MRDERFNKLPTLCWDCANATSNDCPWVDRAEPVPGWGAKETKIRKGGKVVCESYHIRSCPKFVRDAERGGQKKYESKLEFEPLKGETDENSNSNKHNRPDAWDRMVKHNDSQPVGNRGGAVADKGSRGTWGDLNNVERDPFDLALGIIERYALDWRALEFGARDFVLVDGVLVSKEDTACFFFEPWFETLCTAIHYTPKQIRKALRIPEDLIERLIEEARKEGRL